MYVENIVNLANAAQRAAMSAEQRKVPNKPANQRKDNKTQRSDQYFNRLFVPDDLSNHLFK